MDTPTALKRWLAAVRVVTGGVFVYMASGHLLGGVGHGRRLPASDRGLREVRSSPAVHGRHGAAGSSCARLLWPTVRLRLLAAGIGIALGLLTPVALLGGVWLSLNNLRMGFGAGSVHHSLNTLMLTVELGFLWTGAWWP